jgi:hypothetical protein
VRCSNNTKKLLDSRRLDWARLGRCAPPLTLESDWTRLGRCAPRLTLESDWTRLGRCAPPLTLESDWARLDLPGLCWWVRTPSLHAAGFYQMPCIHSAVLPVLVSCSVATRNSKSRPVAGFGGQAVPVVCQGTLLLPFTTSTICN